MATKAEINEELKEYDEDVEDIDAVTHKQLKDKLSEAKSEEESDESESEQERENEEQESEEKLDAESFKANYKMNQTVKHNMVRYEKGKTYSLDKDTKKLFVEKGWAKPV